MLPHHRRQKGTKFTGKHRETEEACALQPRSQMRRLSATSHAHFYDFSFSAFSGEMEAGSGIVTRRIVKESKL